MFDTRAQLHLHYRSYAYFPTAIAMLAACPAMAQAPAAADGAAEVAGNEILVTAEKRSTRLVDTPISIVAVSAKQLQNSGVTNLLELPMITPGRAA